MSQTCSGMKAEARADEDDEDGMSQVKSSNVEYCDCERAKGQALLSFSLLDASNKNQAMREEEILEAFFFLFLSSSSTLFVSSCSHRQPTCTFQPTTSSLYP